MTRIRGLALALLASTVAPVAAQAQVDPLDNGLAAYYPLDGDARDASGNENDGVLHGPRPTEDRTGRPGTALFFDGRSFVDLGPKLQPARFTIAVWVQPRTVDRPAAIISKARYLPGHMFRNLELRIDPGGRVVLQLPGGRRWDALISSRPLVPGRWTQVVAVYDGARASLWLDGVRDAATLQVRYQQSVAPVFVGARPEMGGRGSRLVGPTFFFDGRLDELRIYGRALADREVSALWITQTRPAPAPVAENPPGPPPGDWDRGPDRPPPPGPGDRRDQDEELIRIDRLLARFDLAVARMDRGGLSRVEQEIMDELRRPRQQAREGERRRWREGEHRGRPAIEARRRAILSELGDLRDETDPESLDRVRALLVEISASAWQEVREDLPDEEDEAWR